VGCSLSGLALAAPVDEPARATAEAKPQKRISALELGVGIGPSVVLGEPANPQYTESFTRVGVFAEVALAYRSPYFLDPFLGIAHATLASGTSNLPAGAWGEGGRIEQDLAAWVISPGVTADLWRFRPRLGIGLAIVVQSFNFLGEESSSSQLPIVTVLGLGFNALDDGRFRLDVESRLVVASGADVTFATLDAVLRGDWITFDLD